MRRRLLAGMCLTALVAVVLTAVLSSMVYYGQLERDMRREMSGGLRYIEAGLEAEGRSFLERFDRDSRTARVTLIGSDGSVLYDNQANATAMENHANRPEVIAAKRNGVGEDVRVSTTLAQRTWYLAERLPDGTILRLASTGDTALSELKRNLPLVFLAALGVFLLAFLLARRQIRRIIDPINTINLEEPAGNDVYEELSPLLLRLDDQKQRIEHQMAMLEQRQEEFTAITDNMEEGLIVLDERGNVLFINRSARSLLGAERTEPTGKHISGLNRDLAFQKPVDQALGGAFTEELVVLGGVRHQLRANPVYQEAQIRGAVLLLFDVTEKERAEKLRREFSANVSHELKTPLTAISGFAELLRNGMVPTPDIPSAAERIYEESRRMIGLIDDILLISRLDERVALPPKEMVDLCLLAEGTLDHLRERAEQAGVTLSVHGCATVRGVPRLLEELLFNLCENGIKYNRRGGSVDVRLSEDETQVGITVSDTGIGIPEEHRERVFERFYRVDKSHSRSTGGTGLGLSIVKHITAVHNGALSLDSVPGVGTTIVVSLPKM